LHQEILDELHFEYFEGYLAFPPGN
jgi:hypothetical protein